MKSIVAIVTGSLFIVIVGLLVQLAYIFIAVRYNALAKDYLFLNEISGIFRYLVGIPVFIMIMFVGGYVTANIAINKALFHCLAVAILTTGGALLLTLKNAELTSTGIVVFALAILATVAGGQYWKKSNRIDS